MAKRRRGPGSVDLRAFRSQVAALKKKGLVSKRVDARSQKPTRYMREKVKKLEPVLSGQMVGIKLKPDVLKQYRDAGGFQIVNKRLVLPKDQSEIPGIRRGLPVLRRPLGKGALERIPLPFGTKNIYDLIKDMRENPAKWNALKEPEPKEYFSFKLYRNFSREAFGDVEFMADALERYDPSVFEGLEIVRTEIDWQRPQAPRERRRNPKTVQDRRTLSVASRLEKKVARDERYREEVRADPVRLARKRELERARALRYRLRNKART